MWGGGFGEKILEAAIVQKEGSMPIRFFPKTVDWESRYSRHALVEKHRQNFRHGRVGTIPATFWLFINVSHPIARYRHHHRVGMLLWEATG